MTMITTRKYIFFINAQGVRTYKALQDSGSYKLVKHNGQEVFAAGLTVEFWDWFDATTAITADEFIDFCFLSEREIQLPELPYFIAEQTTWDKEQIAEFCRTCLVSSPNFEIHYATGKQFVVQGGNIVQANDTAKLYLQCMPTLNIADETPSYVEPLESSRPVSEPVIASALHHSATLSCTTSTATAQTPDTAPQQVASLAPASSPKVDYAPTHPTNYATSKEAKADSSAAKHYATLTHEDFNPVASASTRNVTNLPHHTMEEKHSSRVFENKHLTPGLTDQVQSSPRNESPATQRPVEEDNPLGNYYADMYKQSMDKALRNRR